MTPWVAWGLWGLAASEGVTRFGLLRRVFKEGCTAITRLDLGALALMRKLRPPVYALVGSCQRRGACCTQIVADPPQGIKDRPRLLAAFAGMHRLLHNFHVVGRGPTGQLIFRCSYVQTDGRCGIYRLRPRLCRTYPLLPYFTAPKVLPGCGYRVVLRGMGAHAKLPIVDSTVGTHHPTPIRRSDDGALEHAADFVLVQPESKTA